MPSTIPSIGKLMGRSLHLRSLVRPCSSTKSPSELPVEPMEGACCGQGCANCVWITYANEVIDYYRRRSKDPSCMLLLPISQSEHSLPEELNLYVVPWRSFMK
ncbi:Oxidoreductase domain-containing protein [Trichostrongylus colubriformis]|uniref:Oxidoreductase domain-containing protein n=1 Tax=Trichostrongylus colubriformis TaxID=6319 RepID=A0AAN8FGT0_TRICO